MRGGETNPQLTEAVAPVPISLDPAATAIHPLPNGPIPLAYRGAFRGSLNVNDAATFDALATLPALWHLNAEQRRVARAFHLYLERAQNDLSAAHERWRRHGTLIPAPGTEGNGKP